MGEVSLEETKAPWSEVVKLKRDKQARDIEQGQAIVSGLQNHHVESITSIDNLQTLASKIAIGELKAQDVVTAYIRKYVCSQQREVSSLHASNHCSPTTE